MVNKEERYKARTKAQGAIIGAGAAQAVMAASNVFTGATARDIVSFLVFGLAALALAIFFVIFKHPAFGIAGTVLYLFGRVLSIGSLLLVYALTKEDTVLVGLGLSLPLAIGLIAFFVYADVQAFKLRRLEREREESE